MESGEGAVKVVDAADVADDGRLVHVESVEKGSFFSFLRGAKKAEDEAEVKKEVPNQTPSSDAKAEEPAHSRAHSKEVVHDCDEMKTTYDVEEDVPPSLLEQMKRKFHWNGR